jgi:acyl carrier protein
MNNMTEIFRLLSEVFRNVFDESEVVISRETSAKDVPQWDSLMHVALIINVEKAFGVRFLSSEVAGLQNLGELADLIEAKLKS